MEKLVTDKKAVLGVALKNAINFYGLKKKDVQEILGISKRQLQLLQDNGVEPESKTGELVLCFIRIIRSISALVGKENEKAYHWLMTKNKAFRGFSPVERMKSIEGLMEVMRYCDAHRGKI
jgi:hypothetical protein